MNFGEIQTQIALRKEAIVAEREKLTKLIEALEAKIGSVDAADYYLDDALGCLEDAAKDLHDALTGLDEAAKCLSAT